ncbi:hypothetical protein CXB51_022264 [Gossypium anomalum]|uniref:Kinesin motor domain-containing protein n=1 Tax=Gossypium anomalum TaxID=47600 RepID=A0A8J5YQY7_9ROSI|nr:hypothetical protein CXB51_022264 [Gossypium anomalum]
MGGQMQQSNAAAAALYDHAGGGGGGSLHNAGPAGGDAGDAVMARWLQSAGLQHLASPLASSGIDQRLLPNLLMQIMRSYYIIEGYGAQSAEEKQRLFKLMRNLNFSGETGSEPYTPTAQSLGGPGTSDGFYSPEFRGDFGAGLLDLHAMDDTELLSEQKEISDADASASLISANEKEMSARENNVAKIKVVVRKRPLNKKEISRKEDDIVTVSENALTVHEPKLKVDLTAYVEKHEFCFDAVLDEHVTNDEVYRETVEPIIPIIFQRTKATCFAYGQTGSGKTFTMQPLPLRAAKDLVRYLHQPVYRNQRFKLWLSYFEIYGGKLFDLLSDRKKLCMREDGRQQVCIVGLQEFEVSDVQIVKEYIERGNAARSTGSTGANEESSRSHAILQLVIKKHPEIKESKRKNDGDESKPGKLGSDIMVLILARIEGAEINKSLLALKECIRALDNDQIHIPFRGSKLTEVLRDSFVGNSRTVMISCISPNAGSCEHTLNTLRYADRVKSLSKSGNPKKEQAVNSFQPSNKDASSASSLLPTAVVEDIYERQPEVKVVDTGRRVAEKDVYTTDFDKQPSTFSSGYPFNGREESGKASGPTERERFEVNSNYGGSSSQRVYSSNSQNSADTEEKVPKVSPPRTKATREEKMEKTRNWAKKDGGGSDSSASNSRQVNAVNNNETNTIGHRQYDPEEKQEKTRNWAKKDGGSDFSASNLRQVNAVNNNETNTVGYRQYDPEEKLEKTRNWAKKDGGSDLSASNSRQVNAVNNNETNTIGYRQYDPEPPTDENINAILEEEEALIAAHRKEIEDTMEIVREEMKLLAEVDQPGSHIDNYVTQLSFVLSRKAASLVSLQARLARFQHRLKEQEILSRKRVPLDARSCIRVLRGNSAVCKDSGPISPSIKCCGSRFLQTQWQR